MPLTGPESAGVKLSGALVYGGAVRGQQVSPDSNRVIYWADQQTVDKIELYSVALTGPATAGVKLNGALVGDGDVVSWDVQVSADSSRVVYRADDQADEVFELFSVPIGGPATAGVRLNGVLADGGFVTEDFGVSPDGSYVVYDAMQEPSAVFEIYRVPSVGPASAGVKVNDELVDGGDVYDLQISPDGSRVVYRADQEKDNVVELYATGATQGCSLYLPLILRNSGG